MSPGREWLERLGVGLESSGFEVLAHEPGYPGQLTVRAPAGWTERYVVYLHWLDGGWGLRRRRCGIWLPPARAMRPVPPGEDLVLGYSPEMDVFASWPGAAPRGLLPRRLEVGSETLREAATIGFRRDRLDENVVAFRPDEAWRHLTTRRVGTRGLPAMASPSLVRHFPRLRTPTGRKREERTAEEIREQLSRYSEMEAEEAIERQLAESPPPPADFKPERPAREVETGFSPAGQPGEPLSPRTPLRPAAEYLFWFAVGADTGASIETKPTAPPAELPDGARLTVQLFPFEEEIELLGPTRGEVELMADGRARVSRHAAVTEGRDGPYDRLLFRVRTAKRGGQQRLRCSLYHGSTLLQSRLVNCRVGGAADPERPALAAELDYALASSLDPESLDQVPAHELSLMVNGGGGPATAPSHQFRFFSDREQPLVADASLSAHEIVRAIEAARGALRLASWKTEAEWVDGQDSYRYENNPGDQGEFERDLITMAIRGHRLYVGITRGLSGGGPTRKALRDAMRKPGRVQIAAASSGLYVPAALFYDQPLESAAGPESREQFRLCAEFLAALDDPASLEETRCITEGCPEHDDRHVVCPSGFWGYRHEIGWPVGGEEPLTRIDLEGRPRLAIGVSTDPRLERRAAHAKRVLAMGTGAIGESRAAFIDVAKAISPHLVYLYCHGGLTKVDKAPYLVLGAPNSDGLDSAYLVDEEIVWGDPPPRPLVFINGCHTTALGPEELGDLVGGFVKDANAVGVIGTEVTIFEPLACDFAENVLASFLTTNMSVGAAIRRARFDLLRARNPLGLVYVPFVAADTRLAPR